MAKSKVDWYGSEVMAVVQDASDDLLTKLAFQGEALAKVGAPVDTGFMRNAIYALGPNNDNRGAAESSAGAAASDRSMAPRLQLEENQSSVHAAARYTIYQEIRVGFMYRALETVAELAGGTVRKVGRDWLGGSA